jgi:AraC-like DNA-binding protein
LVSDVTFRYDSPPMGAVAWLDVSAEDSNGLSGRTRTGPLGLQISPLPQSRAPYFFRGARLRGTRCIWSASTVSGAELSRSARSFTTVPPDGSVQVLARVECPGTVFEPDGQTTHGVLKVIDAVERLSEQFLANTHLFTLNVPQAAIGLEPGMLAEMYGHPFELTDFQIRLLHSAALLLPAGSGLDTPASLVGLDRYLAALTGLLLRTTVRKPAGDPEQLASVRTRTDAIIFEQAGDPLLTPATIAIQLNISLRQLYRAFNGTESPAARIRRRRLDRAAELLAARSPQPNVEWVAQQCGFTSAEYFSRAFRREFGISPRAYRSAHRDVSVAR